MHVFHLHPVASICISCIQLHPVVHPDVGVLGLVLAGSKLPSTVQVGRANTATANAIAALHCVPSARDGRDLCGTAGAQDVHGFIVCRLLGSLSNPANLVTAQNHARRGQKNHGHACHTPDAGLPRCACAPHSRLLKAKSGLKVSMLVSRDMACRWQMFCPACDFGSGHSCLARTGMSRLRRNQPSPAPAQVPTK